jgi:bifunctional non-homologous end joining protein LigD
VKLTHPDKVLFPDPGITKRQLADYWQAVAEVALPFIEHRPLTLFRCPDGYGAHCFYQKHVGVGVPSVVPRVAIKEGEDPYAAIDGVESLLGLVQIGVLELHVWGSRAEQLDKPDMIVLDLDPAPDVPWSEVVAAGYAVKQRLEALGLNAFAKLTGGKGLHVVVPIAPTSWHACLAFARGVAEAMVRTQPRTYTVALPKAGRADKILVDVLRNGRANTAVAAFSARARAGATVSMPIAWDDLAPSLDPVAFTIASVPGGSRADPWREYWRARQRLPR